MSSIHRVKKEEESPFLKSHNISHRASVHISYIHSLLPLSLPPSLLSHSSTFPSSLPSLLRRAYSYFSFEKKKKGQRVLLCPPFVHPFLHLFLSSFLCSRADSEFFSAPSTGAKDYEQTNKEGPHILSYLLVSMLIHPSLQFPVYSIP